MDTDFSWLLRPTHQEAFGEPIAMLEEEWDEMGYNNSTWPCAGHSIDLLSMWFDGSYPHHEWVMDEKHPDPLSTVELKLYFDPIEVILA